MKRLFKQDVPGAGAGGLFAKKGEIREYAKDTWTAIARSVKPKIKNANKALDSFSELVGDGPKNTPVNGVFFHN